MPALLQAWVLFPAVLGLTGYGLGLLVQEVCGRRMAGVLLVPIGLAAVIVIGGILTSWSATAPAATPVVAVLALIGLVLGIVRHGLPRLDWWAFATVIGVLLAYGAPVLLSGHATFTGFKTLDDTASWLELTDQMMSHGRALSHLPRSTYALDLQATIGTGYPLGAFVTLGVGRALVDMDAAWVYQPYMSLCAAMVALGGYALLAPVITSAPLRALAAFIASQAALLYGYAMWGGIKELTLAFLLVLFAALVVEAVGRDRPRARDAVAPAVAAGALIDVIGPGAAVWVIPALGVVAGLWLWRARLAHSLKRGLICVGALVGLALLFALPTLLILNEVLTAEKGFTGTTENRGVELANLNHPLSVFQLGGIWPVHDFRSTPATLPTVLLLLVAGLAAVYALVWSFRRHRPSVALYVGLAMIGVAAGYIYGIYPWVTAKTLALSSPALLLTAMMGGALLWSRSRLAGGAVLAIIAGGVLWSNALAYHDVTLAPRDRMAELEHLGTLVKGKGPTFINEYEVYADRHFLRSGAPIEPAELRPAKLALRDGTILTKGARADLDSFPLATLEAYPSIVTRRSPAESRPPSNYKLVWQGRYYDLWQRPANPPTHILELLSGGESSRLPYCGQAENGPTEALCSVNPVVTPTCSQLLSLGERALSEHAQLVAYQRPAPIVKRGDQISSPEAWTDVEGDAVIATSAGAAVAHMTVPSAQSYEVWLEGVFDRGFEVSVDGRHVGDVKDELSDSRAYIHVADVYLVPGVHTVVLTYPHADLAPGSGDNENTLLSAIALQARQSPASELISVSPQQAARLCGRPLNWIELVTRS